jgi:hypothetical protein
MDLVGFILKNYKKPHNLSSAKKRIGCHGPAMPLELDYNRRSALPPESCVLWRRSGSFQVLRI